MAKPDEITAVLKEKFGDAVLEANLDGKFPHAVVAADRVNEICKFLRDDENLDFDYLAAVSGVDKGERLEAVYIIFSYSKRHSFAIKARVPRTDPRMPSVVDIWAAANWHERETYDLMGIIFEGHPDLRRILLPSDWVGHPLRKDYKYPESYDGITLRRDEEGWPDPGDKELYK